MSKIQEDLYLETMAYVYDTSINHSHYADHFRRGDVTGDYEALHIVFGTLIQKINELQESVNTLSQKIISSQDEIIELKQK